jgi:hypothetical protein
MVTSPVNHSADPLLEGRELFRVISIACSFPAFSGTLTQSRQPLLPKTCSFRDLRFLLCYDHVHRNVIRLRVNRQERLLSIAYAQLEWRVFHRCERQVKEASSVA